MRMLDRSGHTMINKFLLVFIFLSFYSAFSVDVSPTQISSLLNLRNSLDKNLTLLSSWKESNDCSKWLGVECDAGGLVTEINLCSSATYNPDLNFVDLPRTNYSLDTAQLKGSISESIGNLTTLRRLTISGNLLSGGIPSGVGNLIELELLDLTSNYLNGTIPSSIGNLKKLRYLFLSYNALTGNIPEEFGNLVDVISFDVSTNYLNGSVPDSLSNMTKLVIFNVGVNDFAAAPVPSWISNFLNLTYLDYHATNANGSIPTIANLTKLDYIDMSFNKLTGIIDSQFAKLKKPAALVLASNSLSGVIPSSLGSLNLSSLDLSRNKFSGPIPSSLSQLESCFLLDFTSNLLNGSIPSSISKLLSLGALSFGNNKLTGPIPVEITEMPSLMDLSLSDNSLSGQIPTEIGNLIGMSNLFLSNNQLSGPLPNNISLLTNLFNLLVDNNTFSGQMPPEFGKLINLEIFDASSNIFTGIIPPSFGKMKSLTNLRLFQNSLQGPIPDLSAITDLVELDLSLNSLSGPLPNNLSPSLIKLNLRSNSLSGPVPSNFLDRLTNLTTLDLSVNQLTDIPKFKNVPSSFEYISLASNQFSSSTQDITRSDGKTIQIFGNGCSITNTSCFKKYSDYIPPTTQCNAQACYGFDVVNPVTFVNSDSCSCSPPLIVEFKLFAPLFYIFNKNESRNVEGSFAQITGLTESQVQVVNATAVVSNQVTFDVFVLFFTNDGNEWALRDSNGILKALFGRQSVYSSDYARMGPYKILTYLKASKGVPGIAEGKEDEKKDDKVEPWILILVSCLAALVVVTVVVVAFVFVRIYGGKDRKLTGLEEEVMKGMARAVSLSEIQQATKYFSEELLLGAGGFGSVYKGISKNGHLWAVKRAKKVSLQSKSEFENEVLSISKMDHINLVKLLGYCDNQNEQILIYEFMPKGTLRNALDPKRAGVTRPVLTFEERLFIAVGSAAGLSYLHNGATQTIIHRDIKSENILLDAHLVAKVADFGLLKKNENEELENTENTKLAGTPGYMDPEYYTTYKVTTKSDVYSFGVVLLELLTGKAPIMEDRTTIRSKYDQDAVSMITVAKWAVPHIEMGKISDIIDPLLEGNYDPRAAEALSHVAFSCVNKQGKNRPDMTIVVSRLREILDAIKTGAEITPGHFSVTASETDSVILDPPLPSIHESGVSGFYAPSDISFGR